MSLSMQAMGQTKRFSMAMALLLSLYACSKAPDTVDTFDTSSIATTATSPAFTLLEQVSARDAELNIPYSKYRLNNGLTVIIHEDHSDPRIHVDVTYHVGSAREEAQRSGFAHFFEHMMFQGSEHVGDDEHFKIVSEAGGTMNGTTNNDRTNYFETVPSNQLATMLWLESDRMGFLLDAVTQEKYCREPGTFCGLIFLTSVENGEPLAFINDGHLQHMRVGGDGGIGVKYMARDDAAVIGMLGSGGMSRTHMQAFTSVRTIKKIQVFSPTRENCETFASEMRASYNIEVQVCTAPEQVYRGADIIAALTDSAVPVMDGACLEPGQHIVNIGGSGIPDQASLERVDVYLRFGSTPPPVGHPDFPVHDEYIGWEARPNTRKFGDGRSAKRGHGVTLPEKMVTLADLLQGRKPGRTSAGQITYSERGNLQGAQFYAVAGKVYELAKAAGLGHDIPTDLFLQDIRN